MPHITLGNDLPGIVGLVQYRPETGLPLMGFADILLRGDSTLTRGERELIAARVSALNECTFCATSHIEIAAAQLDGGVELVSQVCGDLEGADVSPKLAALLVIASAVQQSGRAVTTEHVAAAREAGATDLEIHDTVLIAAAFCLVNRYVDGLATLLPQDPGYYPAGAKRIVENGYIPLLTARAPAAS